MDIMAAGGRPGNMSECGVITARSDSYAARSLVETSDSALEMSGISPLMVITRSGLKQFTSLTELTVILVLVS